MLFRSFSCITSTAVTQLISSFLSVDQSENSVGLSCTYNNPAYKSQTNRKMNKYEVCCKSYNGDDCILTLLTSFYSPPTVNFTYNPAQTEKVVGEGSFGKALLCKRKSDSKRCIIKQVRKLFSNSTTYCCVKKNPTSVTIAL